MGIRIFQSPSELARRKFKGIVMPTDSRRIRPMDDWCQKYCRYEYAFSFLGDGMHAYFQSDKDAVLFSLRWS